MRLCPCLGLLVVAACASNGSDMEQILPDGGTAAADAPTTTLPDGAVVVVTPDGPPIHGAPGTLTGVTLLATGHDFNDVSADQGGNLWATTAQAVYLFRGGGGGPITYDTSSGLAQGHATWVDTYWFGSPDNPSTQNVTFSAVAGGMAGEVFVGHLGMIGDRLQVDPGSGAVQSIQSLAVTEAQQPDPAELGPQQQREVSVLRAVTDLAGPLGGTVYFGGWHGTSALHGMTLPRGTSVCACADYEEHVHPFGDSGDTVFGTDVRGLALTPEGDLWMGDRRALYFMPERSLGPQTDFFQSVGIPGRPNGSVIDVFPGVDDFTSGIALDANGGIYVASNGNGLAYLAPGSYAPTYFTAADVLPANDLTDVAVDRDGDVWIASHGNGLARYSPSAATFTYYTSKSGLPSDHIRRISLDPFRTDARVLYIATDNGIAVYAGP
jgi:hypothetical protein